MGKIKIYISIPITGHNPVKQRAHVCKVIDMIGSDYIKYRPSVLVEFIDPFEIADALKRLHNAAGLVPPTWHDYMEVDIKALRNCDIIYMCKGWENSNGCKAERDLAESNRLAIMYEESD